MSELTQCNFCSMRNIKADAKKKHLRVTTANCKLDRLPGLNVYVHPKKINIGKLSQPEAEKYWVCWFMKLGNHCEC